MCPPYATLVSLCNVLYTFVCSGPTSVNSSRVSTPAPPGSEASSEVSPDATWGESQDSGRLVPQLRMGKDGRIILDEDRYVIIQWNPPL